MATNLKTLIQEANIARINPNHLKNSFQGSNPSNRGIVFNFTDTIRPKNANPEKKEKTHFQTTIKNSMGVKPIKKGNSINVPTTGKNQKGPQLQLGHL